MTRVLYQQSIGNLQIVYDYLENGFAVAPLSCDGKRTPRIKWSKGGVSKWEATKFFSSIGNPLGIAVLTGSRSGNLEVLDFDHNAVTTFNAWCALIGAMAKTLCIIKTAKGVHVWYRCATIGPNMVLAEQPTTDQPDKPQVLIETRGEGGYVQAPGSPPQTHPRHVQYKVLTGDPFHPPKLTAGERMKMLDAARSLNKWDKGKTKKNKLKTTGDIEIATNRPGDIFNKRGTWEEILTPLGWKDLEHGKWLRPGKDEGLSAAVGGEHESLYVYSTSCHPLEAGTAYTKFTAYAHLHHDSDYSAASKTLCVEGFSEQAELRKYDETIKNLFNY